MCSMNINMHKNIDGSLSILRIEKVFNEHYNYKCQKELNTNEHTTKEIKTMKKEIKNAMMNGIKESDLNGYKWSVTSNGLKWSYGEEFNFTLSEKDDDGDQILTVKAVQSKMKITNIWIGDSFYCDCSSIEEAYKLATRRTIRNANLIY